MINKLFNYFQDKEKKILPNTFPAITLFFVGIVRTLELSYSQRIVNINYKLYISSIKLPLIYNANESTKNEIFIFIIEDEHIISEMRVTGTDCLISIDLNNILTVLYSLTILIHLHVSFIRGNKLNKS